MLEKVGLIAGNRRFPLIFAQEARKRGCEVVAVAIKGNASFRINSYVNKVHWLDIRDFSKLYDIFKNEGIKKVVMAGQINPGYLFNKKVMESREIKGLFQELRDRKANSIFGLIAQRLENKGFELINSDSFMDDYLPVKGVLTKTNPSESVWEDVCFGLEIAKKIADLDIGLTVAVKEKAIVAVEALEGTDNTIKRAGKLTRQGAVITKVSRSNQDMRFDLPLVGLATIKNLIKIKATCLAIEAKRTIFLDHKKAIALADKHSLSIIAV